MDAPVWELTRAIASGDTEAFSRFYRDRFDFVYQEARRATGRDEAFCLDVVQDAMMRVVTKMKPMRDEAALRAWLIRVTRACAMDRLRCEFRRASREAAAGAASPRAAGLDELSEQIRWLRAEMQRLDDGDARLLSMRFGLDWTLARIGRAMGLKPGAVDGRVRRALDAMRQRAEEAGDA